MVKVHMMLNRALKASLLVGVFSIVLLVSSISQATAQSKTLVVVFNWSFRGFSWGPWKVELPRQVYNHYDSLLATDLSENYTLQLSSEIRIWDYKYFATWQEKSIEELAKALEVAATNSRYDYYDKAGFILAFVQSVAYTTAQERPRFPIETLVEGGVCSDKSILYATLVVVLRYDVVFLHFPSNNTRPGHLAVGVLGRDYPGTYYVYSGKQYYYCETTKPGWKFGEIRPDLNNTSAYVLDSYCSQPIPEFPQDHVLVIATFVSVSLVFTKTHNTRKNRKQKRETDSKTEIRVATVSFCHALQKYDRDTGT